MFVSRQVLVTSPASSANLGPGFDCLALALELRDEIRARVVEDETRVSITGEGAQTLPRDESHLVVHSMRRAFDAMKVPRAAVQVECVNRIPHARGLGSSSAAIVGGILAARALVAETRFTDTDVLQLAADIEGHRDNVTACALGGVVLSWVVGGSIRTVPLAVSPKVSVMLYVPRQEVKTEAARATLPEKVPHQHAAANAAAAALLIHALTHDPALLWDATQDWLHQPYRADVMPNSFALLEKLRGMGIPAVLSGAGPSVLAFTSVGTTPTHVDGFTAYPLAIAEVGAQVS